MTWWKPWTWGKKSLDDSRDSQTTDQTFNAFIMGETALRGVKIAPKDAYSFYESVSPLSDSVRKISEKIRTLSFGLKNKDGEIEKDHEIIQLLKNPGGGISSALFIEELTKSMLLTSENWVIARGNVDRPPLELAFVRPFEISVTTSSKDGLPLLIQTTAPNDKRTYTREDGPNGFRYIDEMRLNEIIPNIAETTSDESTRGQSKLAGIKDDLEQLRNGKTHNLSLLKNGAKPSLIAMPKEGSLQQDAVNSIAGYFKAQQQGANNAGNVWVQSKPLDIQGFGMTNTDMDYKDLQRDASYSVYNTFNIPLSLVSAETMTMDNYKISIRSLYTEAVFPEWRNIIPPLVAALAPRYKNLDGMVADFDPLSIPAMRETWIDQMTSLRNSKSVSVNEARRAGGFEDIPGGDVVLIQANELPLMSVEEPPADLAIQDEAIPEGQSGDEPIQQTALNGAQVQALSSLVQAVGLGTLSRDSAVALARAAFPAVPEKLIAQMFSDIPETPEEDPKPAPEEPEEPEEEEEEENADD